MMTLTFQCIERGSRSTLQTLRHKRAGSWKEVLGWVWLTRVELLSLMWNKAGYG